jgi:peptidoglycan hydrolase-like protein with peptidoglycan-binding domain
MQLHSGFGFEVAGCYLGLTARRRPTEPLKRDDILALWQGLSAQGLMPGPPDGVAGTATRQAVRAFQKANGLAADGFIDLRFYRPRFAPMYRNRIAIPLAPLSQFG